MRDNHTETSMFGSCVGPISDAIDPMNNEGAASRAVEDTPDGSVSKLASSMAQAYLGSTPRTERPPVDTLAPAEVLCERYVVSRLLARGGMGEVYSAFDLELARDVAIKTMLSTLADDRHAIRRLHREARLGRRITHPNVCRVHGIFVHQEDPRDVVHFIAMDLLQGQSLREYARLRPLAIPRVVEVATEVLLALEAVHAARVLHRDLKAQNVILDAASGRAVLIDFGLARALDRRSRVCRASVSGSLGYMAPEQVHGGELCPRTDIFAFGVIMYELLTGRLPTSKRFADAVHPIVEASAAVPSHLRSDVPESLDEVVYRCLQPSPEDRYPNAHAALSALRGAG